MLRSVLLLVLLLAAPGTRAAELRIAVAASPFTADPHFYNGALDKGLALHIFSRLVEQTPDTKLEPGLALSWHARSDTLWEFRLRPGVTFSDGAPLTPDDIVFSLARAPTVPNTAASFAPLLRTVSRVESPDPQTLLIHTNRPHPNLPNDLANIAIVSRRAGEGATRADYNSGKAAIGSGPYKLASFESRERIVLDRNPSGFRMSLFGSIQGETLQAVAGMWSRVGVRTTVEMLPNSTFSTRAARQDFPASGGSWGSKSGAAGYFLVNVITTNEKGAGPLNWGRYSNKALDALTERAMATIDDNAREALLRDAERMAMEDVAVIPVFQLVNVWAFRKGIVYEPRADERMVAMSARPAPRKTSSMTSEGYVRRLLVMGCGRFA